MRHKQRHDKINVQKRFKTRRKEYTEALLGLSAPYYETVYDRIDKESKVGMI